MTDPGMRKGAPPDSGTPCLKGTRNAGPTTSAPHRVYAAAIVEP